MTVVFDEICTELEKTQQDFWNISRQTAQFISMLVKISSAKNVLEVGTSNGYSALWLASALKETGGHLTTIEFYEKRQCIARENIEKCGLQDIVTFKQGRALEILPTIDFEPDLVFIDANKSEYIQYFNLIKDKMKKGSVILADNVISHAPKVEDFLKAIDDDPNYQSEILDLPAGLLMAYKLN